MFVTRRLARNIASKLPIRSTSNIHFRATNVPHPLNAKPAQQLSEAELADKFGRQQNHIWTLEELKERTTVVYRHTPQTISDHVMRTIMSTLCKATLHKST